VQLRCQNGRAGTYRGHTDDAADGRTNTRLVERREHKGKSHKRGK
jgi:hypothetical protein